MKFLPLVLANLGRKKVRTLLTLGSFAVALFLFGLLVAIRGAFNQGVDVAGNDRLMIINRTSLIQPLPLPYRDRVQKIPGVTDVTFASWFGGVYQDERNFFAQFAIDPDTYRTVYPEFRIPEEQWQAFLADRAGCVAGAALAKRFGWKIGDRIPIKGTAFPGTWEFNLQAIYEGRTAQDDLTQFWFQRKYFEEKGPPFLKGLVGWYVLRISHPDDAVRVSKAIDEEFSNSAYETRTQTEKAMAASFVKQMGNIEFLILSIGAVVFFTLLLVIGNTMATAVRERTSELAVLKALGYSDRFVLSIVIAESLLLAVVGGGAGLALAKAFSLGGDPTGGMLPIFYIPPVSLAAGLALALAVGVAAAIIPAISAMRLRVVDALRRV
ncbi:MAG TPA: FtsX-like permease family protein [Vicinamibacteria bacterium]